MSHTVDHRAALHAHFGFSDFRPGQETAVRAALAGRDVLVIMPTGAGKSLCYQLPALMRADLTLVVSPLISLMTDQAQALGRRAPGAVALINGQQDARENEAALAAAVRGELRVLHVAPERFSSPGFLAALQRARVGLFVVDEAHCVSQWGHDFRPDYLRLGEAARRLGAAAILASTATATPSVAHDIVVRLGLREPERVATGFDRPNLSFAVVRARTAAARTQQIVAALELPGATPAIVYTGTRRAADALAAVLADALEGSVVAYHAGLERAVRARAQQRFMDGEADVVVATNAFGMGVDKADVRTVLHASAPPSLEAYYQEAGRAGRDGAPARALLLSTPADKGLHVHFVRRAEVADEDVASVAVALQAAAGGPPAVRLPGMDGAPPRYDIALDELRVADPERVRAVVGALERAGIVAAAPAPMHRLRGRLLAPWDASAAARCRDILAEAHAARWSRYHAVWSWVESGRCRRAGLLAHFGDPAPPAPSGPCCDACDPSLRVIAAGAERRPAGRGLDAAGLQNALLATLAAVELPLARAELAAVLRGIRTRAVRADDLDGLPTYGTWEHLDPRTVLAAVAELEQAGRLVALPGDSVGLPDGSQGIAGRPGLRASGRRAAGAGRS